MKKTERKTLKQAILPVSGGTFVGGSTSTSATPAAHKINAQGGLGTNIAGASLSIAGGRPTGSGAGGSVKLETAAPGASGTTARALVNRVEVDTQGVTWIGPASTAPTVGVATKVGMFVQSGILKGILPTDAVKVLGYTPATIPAAVITDSTTGVAAASLVDVTVTPTQATINANFATVAARLAALEASLLAMGAFTRA